MRYLTINKSGIWQFRFQLPKSHRPLFNDCREIKRSLNTSDKKQAIIAALELETQIRKTILAGTMVFDMPLPIFDTQTSRKSAVKPCTSPSQALERFMQYKRNHISEKEFGMLKAKCQIVLNLLNKTELQTIRRVDAENVSEILRSYPTNLKKQKQFNGLSGIQAIELNQQLKMPTLSEESVKSYCQKMSGFFEWCVQNELTDINPFKAIRFRKTRKDSEAKHAYSITDLQKIFSSEIYSNRQFKHNYYFWLPILAYLTGARLNELCQLYKADVYQHEGVWLIRIDDKFEGQKLKNLASRRLIPIHNKLIELGFIDFVQTRQHERVFPELANGRDGFGMTASKWYGRYKAKLGFGKGHDFHSFRHTVATQFKRLQISHITAGEILGHTQNNITYDRYGKGLDIAQMQEVINLIDTQVFSETLS